MLKCFDLTGKICFVTGASKGIGFALANALAQSGSDLFICARNGDMLQESAEKLAQNGTRVEHMILDIVDANEAQNVVIQAVQMFGRIDVLVNNAATGRDNIPPEDFPLELWDRVLNINVTGQFNMAQIVGRQMIKQRAGKIINIASMSGLIINRGVHGGAYDVSKHALIGLTKALAVEWVRYGIQVNALAPGYVMTDPNREYFEKNPGLKPLLEQHIPMGRIAETDELGGAIVMLASSASDYMCGSTLVIDGGYTVW